MHTNSPILRPAAPRPDSAPRRASSRDLQALLNVAAGVSLAFLGWQAAFAAPAFFGGLSVDRMTALLALLVSVVGAVTFRYSVRLLDGNPRQGRFLALLAGTVLSALTLVCAGNLALLFAAWIVTSLGLHALLTFCDDRPESRRPARKKFLISRIGDVALLAALLILWRDWGTSNLAEVGEFAARPDQQGTVRLVGLLVSMAALAKSAQFPFHSWLPETMEAPTPVSALMHAGIINAGGVLLLKFAPVISRSPESWLLLASVGSLTVAVGMMSMWAQVKVKRTLAWSTVGQMGFMVAQCGLCAFPAVVLHVLGHGCYKAWSFLRCGEVEPVAAAPVPPLRGVLLGLIGAVAAAATMYGIALLRGLDRSPSPSELSIGVILSIAIGQVWVAILGRPARGTWQFIRRGAAAATLTGAASLAAAGLYAGAEWFLRPVLADVPQPAGPAAWIAASIPAITVCALAVMHALLPILHRSAAGRALHVHALQGFYFGAIADRLVDAIMPPARRASEGTRHA